MWMQPMWMQPMVMAPWWQATNAGAQTRYGGVDTACGLAQGMDFPASVAPFILRAVKLVGIDSVRCPMERRRNL